MRRRYVTLSRPRADDDEYWTNEEIERHLMVYEPESRPQETGLYDRHGAPLYAIDEREPIGFVHFEREARSLK